MKIHLPNIRKLFIPDPGYVIFDADLSGADAQVVAWEANDEDLKKAFRAGVKIHEKNATDLFGDEYRNASGERSSKSTPKGKLYDQCKRAVHATNYGASPFTLTRTPEIAWPTHRSEGFQRKWFNLHPGIHQWHRRIESNLKHSRSVSNRFGYRIIYFDRVDGLLPKGLAWIPQSTVALVCFKGALRLQETPEFRLPKYKNATPEELRNLRRQQTKFSYVEILIQVHDSLVFQLPKALANNHKLIKSRLEVPVPYDDPLIIPWGLVKSEKSWGDCEAVD